MVYLYILYNQFFFHFQYKNKTTMPFRIHRKKVGLTYSCPTVESGLRVDNDNPITDHQQIIEFLESKGDCDYIVSKEEHEEGTIHWHCDVKYSQSIDTTDERFFDLLTVHPNIINPGKGWRQYVLKFGDWLSNYYGKCPWTVALKLDTPDEAIQHLWETMPKEMSMQSHNIESNIRKKMRFQMPHTLYEGPYRNWIPHDWNPKTHSLLITGPPGVYKTQFARYIMSHMFGQYHYIKGTLQNLKNIVFDRPLLFDEIHMLGDIDPEQSKEITDVENGGTIKMRHTDIIIPPGIPRIFLHNLEYPFKNPCHAVYDRRVITQRVAHDFHEIFQNQSPDF